MPAVITNGFGEDGSLYAAVCGEHRPPWKSSSTSIATVAARSADLHNTIIHPGETPAELDIPNA